MKFNVLQKKINDGKMYAVVKLIIVNCNFDLPEEKSRRICQKQDGLISLPKSCMCHQFNVKRYKCVFRI